LELRDFHYFSGNTGIWSRSQTPTRVSKVVIDATVLTPLVDEKKAEGDRYLSQIHIGEFKIAEISGSGVHYQNFKSGLHVSLGSGRLLGIEAGNVTVDLPKTDKDALLIRGGYATVARAENLRVAASTGTGLALSTTLNTGTLFAEFAKDGKVTADLEALSAD